MKRRIDCNYDTCAVVGTKGGSAFGRHLFYQMGIIGNFRLGRTDEAMREGCAAQNGLQISAWHVELAKLTLGNITANQLMAHATDHDMRFQVRCFEGLRAFTNGNKDDARRILNSAATMPNDLPMEFLFVKADLDRCSQIR